MGNLSIYYEVLLRLVSYFIAADIYFGSVLSTGKLLFDRGGVAIAVAIIKCSVEKKFNTKKIEVNRKTPSL